MFLEDAGITQKPPGKQSKRSGTWPEEDTEGRNWSSALFVSETLWSNNQMFPYVS